MEQPIKNCYWVSPGQLLAGEYPRNWGERSSRKKIKALLDAGVKTFIDLTEVSEALKPYTELLTDAVHRRFPIRDMSIPESQAATEAILNAIDRHIDTDEMVYLHCWGGIGRTGTIVGCWLARHGLGGDAALKRLQELWQTCPKSKIVPHSPQTPTQEKLILDWKVHQ